MCLVQDWKVKWNSELAKSFGYVINRFDNVSFLFLTLTVPDDVEIKDIACAQWLFCKTVLGNNPSVYGYMSAPDFKWKDNKKSHYHYHIVVAVSPEYYSRYYVSQELYTKYWVKSLSHYGVVVDK